ncbi:sortase [Patescibacteria group bacterium]|nr:sortase [Patescibacteria group bacterium]
MSDQSLAPRDTTMLVAALRDKATAFLFVFFVVFTLSYIILTAFGAVPKNAAENNDGAFITETESEEAVEATGATTIDSEPAAIAPENTLPFTMIIDKLNRELPVLNPQSRVIADLDEALLGGVVRHPDSATFADDGNMFILGHSSYLPSVNNEYFQAFNGIQDLEWGDTIRLRSADTEYVYQVERVYKASASELVVPIANTGKRLTLATCNSFGSKDDRYIVEAKLLYSEAV